MAAATIGSQLVPGAAKSSDMHSAGNNDNLLGAGDSLFAGMFEAAAGTGTQTATDTPVLADAKSQPSATQGSFVGTFDKAPDLSRGSLQQISLSATAPVSLPSETTAAPMPAIAASTLTDSQTVPALQSIPAPQTVTTPQAGNATSDAAPGRMGGTSNVEAPQVDSKNTVGTIAAQELPAPVAQDKLQPVDSKPLPQTPHESDAEAASQPENISTLIDGNKVDTSDSKPAVAVGVKSGVLPLPATVQPEPFAQDAPAQPEIPAQAESAVQATPNQKPTSTEQTLPQAQAPAQTPDAKTGTQALPVVMPGSRQHDAYQAIVRAIGVGTGTDVLQTDAPMKTDNPKSPASIDTKEDVPQASSFSEEKNDAQDNGQDVNLVAGVTVPVLPAQLAGNEPTKIGKGTLYSSASQTSVHSSKGSVSGKISSGETGNNVVPQQQSIQSDAVAVNAIPMNSAAPTVQKQAQEDSVEGSLQTVVAAKTVTPKAAAGKFGRSAQVMGRQKAANTKDEKAAKSETGVTKTWQDVSTPAEKNTSAGNETAVPQVAHSPAAHTVDNRLHAVSALKVDTGVNSLQDLADASKPAQSGTRDPFARLDAAAGANAQENGAQWIAAGHRQIEVAIADETHGVMHVRAEKGSDNTVQAVVMASSEFSHEVLKAEAPHITSFLSQQTVPVDRVQVVRMQDSAAMNMDLGGRAQQERGQQSSGTDAGAEQKKLVWRQVGASPSLSTTSRGVGLLSVRA
ncbi:hypothetical protein [Terriglobus albidus]|uniref:hypothetical protein n=1 Tax=Terriglobus albidus TaxID=1592106 RepID=UPI0021E0B8FE|nr:hypothetical protein [Terriglobus albidus]